MAKKKIKESSLKNMSAKQLEKWNAAEKKRQTEKARKEKLLADAQKLRNK